MGVNTSDLREAEFSSRKNTPTVERFKPSETGEGARVFGENASDLREAEFLARKIPPTVERFKPSETGEGARVFGENASDLREAEFSSRKNTPTVERFKIDFTASLVTGGGLRSRIEELRSCYDPRCVAYFEDIQSKRKGAFCDSASGFMLLDSLLQKNKIDRLKTAILLDAHGRPYIDDPELDFSVSHSEGCAICALAIGEGAAVGCDVQRARRYSDEKLNELAAAFMTEDELAAFRQATDRAAFFFNKWTRREAYVKRVGSDIFDNLKTADLNGEYFREGVITACGERYFYSINTLPLEDDAENPAERINSI